MALSAAIIAAFAVEFATGGYATCEAHGLIPADPTLEAAITSLFLHDPSDLAHIGGNIAFLLVFGSIVEPAIGRLRLIALFAAAGLVGAALHILVDPSSTTPLVGSSGAVCGLLAVAAVVRPQLLGFAVAFIGFEVSRAFTGDEGPASFACHVGGFASGVVFAALARARGVELRRPGQRRAIPA